MYSPHSLYFDVSHFWNLIASFQSFFAVNLKSEIMFSAAVCVKIPYCQVCPFLMNMFNPLITYIFSCDVFLEG